MPSILNYQEFCENLREITSTKKLDKRKFYEHGLFSEQIFGPVKNYTCQCGVYHGISRSGGTCNKCGVDITNSNERRRRFAKIILPFRVVNPIMLDLLYEIGGSQIRDNLFTLMKNDLSALYMDGDDLVIVKNTSAIPNGTKFYETYDAIRKLVEIFAQKSIDSGDDRWKIIQDNINQLFLREIIVLPPDLRPASKGDDKYSYQVDKINRYYTQILSKKESMTETIVELDKKTFYSYFKQLQRDVDELYEHIIQKMSKKGGLIRGNILGKRIDFSGRAVIIPDPTLNLDECVLPYLMFIELYKLPISKRLIEIGIFRLLNEAIDFVDECEKMNNQVLLKIAEEIAVDEVCLLNRQPSLHRLGMMGFNIKISLDKVIKIHPLACPGFNADFDGDQMAVYIPISEEAKQEVRDKFMITQNLRNPSNNSLTTVPSQDIVLGIYMLTANKFPQFKDKVDYKGTHLSQGRVIFNECLPKDYPAVDGEIREKILIEILNDISKRYPIEETKNVLDKIKTIGFKYSTLFGSSMSLQSCYLDRAQEMRDNIYSSDEVRDQLVEVSKSETQDLLKREFKYSYLIESGARGSWDQVRQIILTRGFVSNFHGQILPTPIKNSLLSGLTEEEFFNSTYGCRKGLLDVALNTGTSGYLSRKLIFTCANLQIDKNNEDCGSTDFLEVFIPSQRKAEMMIGKFFKDENGNLDMITEKNFKSLVNKTILVRSPIYCKSERLCKTCYGNLHEVTRSKFVGVIAAQALGECNTQLILRTFHTSGVAVIKGDSSTEMQQEDIVGDLSSASKLLHKFQGKTPAEITNDLFNIYNSNRRIHHVHFECVVSQLMWYGYYKWRLLNGREKLTPEFHSVQTVPSYESWLLGLAFSNPKKHIIKGVLYSGCYKGVMDKLLCGEKIE